MAATLVEAPRFLILKAPGTNRDGGTQKALDAAGATSDIMPIQAVSDPVFRWHTYQGLIIPGGFSYGDDIQSGVALALEMHKFQVEIEEFALHHKKPVVGICNGFQGLIQSGLLPFGAMTTRDQLQATLTANGSGRFESRWVKAKSLESVCLYVHGEDVVTAPVAMGEGRFVASPEVIQTLHDAGQIVYQYVDSAAKPTQEYPANPNGSMEAIAGITDPGGTIFGSFLHFEDFTRREHHPNWRRGEIQGKPHGLQFYENVVLYAAGIAGA